MSIFGWISDIFNKEDEDKLSPEEEKYASDKLMGMFNELTWLFSDDAPPPDNKYYLLLQKIREENRQENIKEQMQQEAQNSVKNQEVVEKVKEEKKEEKNEKDQLSKIELVLSKTKNKTTRQILYAYFNYLLKCFSEKKNINDVTINDMNDIFYFIHMTIEDGGLTEEKYKKWKERYFSFDKLHLEFNDTFFEPVGKILENNKIIEDYLNFKNEIDSISNEKLQDIKNICFKSDTKELYEKFELRYNYYIKTMKEVYDRLFSGIAIIFGLIKRIVDNKFSEIYANIKIKDFLYIDNKINRIASKYVSDFENLNNNYVKLKMYYDNIVNIAIKKQVLSNRPVELDNFINYSLSPSKRLDKREELKKICQIYKEIYDVDKIYWVLNIIHKAEKISSPEFGYFIPYTADDIIPPFTKEQEREFVREYITSYLLKKDNNVHLQESEKLVNTAMTYY